MKCPVCIEPNLVMAARLGIEIDYCGQCRGVWLDRGELDKIIERSMTDIGAAAGSSQPGAAAQTTRGDCDDRSRQGHYPPKRHGFLKDLFD